MTLAAMLAVGEPALLESRAGVDTRAASYAADTYFKGSYVVVTPWMFVPLAQGLWASVGAPLEWATAPNQEVYGLGDVWSAIGWRAVQREEWAIDLALAESWPLGDPHHGLGSAQLQLSPTVAGQMRYGRFFGRSSAALRWAIPWGAHGDHDHLSYTAPYDLLDLALRFEAGVQLFDWVSLVALVEPTVALVLNPVWPVGSRVDAGGGARFSAGAFFGEAVAMAPVSSNHYELWQVRVALGARF
jgi:hypothetical protein